MRIRNIRTLLASMTLFGVGALLMFPGCDNAGDVLTPSELAPPSNFRAVSQNVAVSLSWTASPDNGSSDFEGYRIVTTNALNVVVDSAATTGTTYTVTGLANGNGYTFTLRSVNNGGEISVPVVIQWGPTVRYGFQSLYEYDSSEPSGLQFSAGQRFNFTIPNQSVIDLWIDGRSGTAPLLKSPNDFIPSAGWRRTLLVETSASNFNDYLVIPDVTSFRSTPGVSIVSGKVYFAITQDGNYAKFRVEPPGIQVDPANNRRFVNITVAYNAGTGDWAKVTP